MIVGGRLSATDEAAASASAAGGANGAGASNEGGYGLGAAVVSGILIWAITRILDRLFFAER